MKLNANEALAFEDSENGILSSVGANLKTVVTTNGYTVDHDFSGALIVLDQMGDKTKPFNVVEGDAGEHGYLNVAMLRDLFAR